MNVHGALNRRVRRVGVHHVEDRLSYLIALDPQQRRHFRFGVHQNVDLSEVRFGVCGRPLSIMRSAAAVFQQSPKFKLPAASEVYAAFCAVERLSHSSKRIGASCAFLAGVRL